MVADVMISGMGDTRFQDIWVEQCRAARDITERFEVTAAFDYVVREKLMMFAAIAATRPEYARELPRFVAEVRRLFSARDMRENFARVEREERDQSEAASEASADDFGDLETPELDQARRERFLALKELLMNAQLGTS